MSDTETDSMSRIKDAAKVANITFSLINAKMDDAAVTNKIKSNYELGDKLTIAGLPAMIINGKLYRGLMPKSSILALLSNDANADVVNNKAVVAAVPAANNSASANSNAAGNNSITPVVPADLAAAPAVSANSNAVDDNVIPPAAPVESAAALAVSANSNNATDSNFHYL